MKGMGNRVQRKAVRRQDGITLIELMVVVVVIAILAAIAYPSYQEYIRRAARAEAEGILLENAQFLERNYTLANRYDLDNAGNATVLPFTVSPKAGEGPAKYNITAAYATPQVFTLSATPTGSMTGDACGTLTITEAGVKGAGGTVADCWKQ
jgi:type IV pilus assembly protein PilE